MDEDDDDDNPGSPSLWILTGRGVEDLVWVSMTFLGGIL